MTSPTAEKKQQGRAEALPFFLVPTAEPAAYLAESQVLDYCDPSVHALAMKLKVDGDPLATTRAAFRFVRDKIAHSCDVPTDRVSVTASQTLAWRTGLCFAKSHLLAALLRACGVPAGLRHQRVAFAGAASGFALHGLAAALLPEHGWYAMDARGGQPGARAKFDPPAPCLAYPPGDGGEKASSDPPSRLVRAEPLPQVLAVLRGARSLDEALANLPGDVPASAHFLKV